jgi:Ser/Thr protein kinase RdoA (MazF antagonist)
MDIIDDRDADDIAAARARLTGASVQIAALAGATADAVLSCRNGRVVLAGSLDGHQAVFKIALSDRDAPRIRRQDAALRHFAGALSSGPFRVPRSLGAFPTAGIGVQSRIQGVPLDRLLTPAAPGERARLLTRAGGWLRRAASVHREDDRFGGGFWVRFLGGQAAKIEGEAGGTARALVRLLERRAMACGTGLLVRALLHGDYRARNLMWDGDALTALDFDDAEVRPISREAATLLVDLARREPGADHAADRAALLAGCALAPHETTGAVPFFETREILHDIIRSGGNPSRMLMRQAAAHLAAAGAT